MALSSELLSMLPRNVCAPVLFDLYDYLMVRARVCAHARAHIQAVSEAGVKREPFTVAVHMRRTWRVCVGQHMVRIPTSLMRDMFGTLFVDRLT
jgi:hypothetical protein